MRVVVVAIVNSSLGTSVGYVLPMVCIAFVGMFVTAATSILYSEIIWDPVDLVVGWDSVPMSIFSFILVAIATITQVDFKGGI